ncbi:MAG: glycosyltransferase family 4 protein [Anaerolineae bacterium]
MGIRIGFHYHIPMLRRPDGLYTPGYLGRFLDSLAKHCEHLVCFMHSPLPDEENIMDYRLLSSNLEYVDIGPHTSVPRRTLAVGNVIQQVRGHRADLDVMLIRGPSPLLPFIAWAVRPVPTALLLVGDYLAGIDDLPQPWWRKELIRLWSYANFLGQMRVAKRSLTFVNSRLLYDQLKDRIPHLVETRTTTLNETDFYYREDTCQHPPYRLLYTGRISVSKGLTDVVEALAVVVGDGIDAVFEMAGPLEPNDPAMEEVFTTAERLRIRDRVRYHGYKPVGPELFELYKQADIFVIASRSSEGFPRVIWEAMAHSLPVVATRVGSIPHLLASSALLVAPGQPEELAQAIADLLRRPSLRREQIRRGVTLARRKTLELQISGMISAIQGYITS